MNGNTATGKFVDSKVRQVGAGVAAGAIFAALVGPGPRDAVSARDLPRAEPRQYAHSDALYTSLLRLGADLGRHTGGDDARHAESWRDRVEIAERLGFPIPDLTGREEQGEPLILASESETGRGLNFHLPGSPLPEGRPIVGLTRDGNRPLVAPFFRGDDITLVRAGVLVTMPAAELLSELRASPAPGDPSP